MKSLWLLALCLPIAAFSQIMRIHQSDGSIHDYSVAEIDSITFAGMKIYHSGDTGKIAEMAALTALNLNYAMLCIDGVYNMNALDAAAVAQMLPSAKAIPIHVAPSNASAEEKQRNIDKFNPPNRMILKEGETIYL